MKTCLMLLTLWFCLTTSKHHYRKESSNSKTGTTKFESHLPNAGYMVKSARAKSKQGRVSVVDTNLNRYDQNVLMNLIQNIYDNVSDQLGRARQFQDQLSYMYSSSANVVVNFDALAYYQRFYIYIEIDDDIIFGWGI